MLRLAQSSWLYNQSNMFEPLKMSHRKNKYVHINTDATGFIRISLSLPCHFIVMGCCDIILNHIIMKFDYKQNYKWTKSNK